MPTKRRLALYAAVTGVAVFLAAMLVAVRMLGFGEALTSTVDGLSAMEDGKLTPFGWWSVIWRAGLAGLGAAALTGGVIAFIRRDAPERP